MSAHLDVTILGCGSSGGVPRIGGLDGGGDWGACDPTNPKNRRRRCSVLVRRHAPGGETAVLVDTAPDMREQLIDAHVRHLDAVLITHDHADQLHGIDDLRALVLAARKRINLYTDHMTFKAIRRRFGYIFERPDGSDYPPILDSVTIEEPFSAFEISGVGGPVPVLPFEQEHGRIRSLGFRFGGFAYSSDVNGLDDAAFDALDGVDTWVVDALRYKHHPTHANVETALKWIARVRPRRAVLTNLHLDLDYETLKSELPPGIEPAYDGMVLTVPAE
jgi:phosphoribosyl 1,2-cyclic phosphate phosphodiesterase